jgi:hypothetical protein
MLATVEQSVATVDVISGPLGQTATTVHSTGSGFFIDSHGHLLTSAHVIADAWKVDVTTKNGTATPASLIGVNRGEDIAELQVDGPSAGLQFSPDPPTLNQHIYIIGNPLGSHPNTVTDGHVQNVNQSVSANGDVYSGVVITDADAEPGNSGGPVVNEHGRVVGILTGGTANRVQSFFIPEHDGFDSTVVAWRNAQASPFQAPPPAIRITAWADITCGVDGCSAGMTAENFGGPGSAQITVCVVASQGASCDPGHALSVCVTQVTMAYGETRQFICKAPSNDTGSVRLISENGSIDNQMPAPL